MDSLHDLLVAARSFAGHLKWRVLRSPRGYISHRFRKSSVFPGKNGDKTILFFSPEAGVEPHYAAQCVLARTLKEAGHKVLFARCFEVFERCPVMDMYQLPFGVAPETTAETCLKCAGSSIEMLDSYGLESLDLRACLTSEVTVKYRQAVQNLPADLRRFEYDSVPFGTLCIHDLVLATKISNFAEVSEENQLAWSKYIRSSLLSYLIVDEICSQGSIGRIVHFNDYSLMLGARLAARKHGIPSYTVTLAAHNVIDRRRFLIVPEIIWLTFEKQSRAWPVWRDLYLSAAQVVEVVDDLLMRFGAKNAHTYSPAKTFQEDDIRTRLNLPRDKKLLVAYTSSLDEILAGATLKSAVGSTIPDPPQPFKDQIEWLHSLVDFVGKRDDLQLVVRIHPREGANKRDLVNSMHLARLREVFDRALPNCLFVWPGEQVSSYDLGEAADLVLTSWSTIGLELARLGVPVLTSTNGLLPFPHDSFSEWGKTPAEYFAKLEMLLDRPVTLDTVARAFRWYNLLHLGTSLDLRDVVPSHDFEGLPEFKLPKEAEAIEDIIINGKHVVEVNLESQKRAQNTNSAREERSALERQLRRIIHFLFTGEDSPADLPLLLAQSGENSERDFQVHGSLEEEQARALEVRGSQVSYRASGKTYERYSPMIARLAALCGQTGSMRESSALSPPDLSSLSTGVGL